MVPLYRLPRCRLPRCIGMREVAALALLAFPIAMAEPMAAQQPSPGQIATLRQACRSDFIAHCSGVQPGGREALQCLERNAARLSAECGSAVSAVLPKAERTQSRDARGGDGPADAARGNATAGRRAAVCAGSAHRRPGGLYAQGFHVALLLDCAGEPRASAVPAGQCGRTLAGLPKRRARDPGRRHAVCRGSTTHDCTARGAAGRSGGRAAACSCGAARSHRATAAERKAAQRHPCRLPVGFHSALLRRAARRPGRADVP